jgi:hypothetical protein
MITEVKPGFHVWHIWCDQQGVSHQKKEWINDFMVNIFIEGIPSVGQSGGLATMPPVLCSSL